MFAPDYWLASYFAPDYWLGTGASSGGSAERPAYTPYRDRDAFDDIVRRLAATGAFSLVTFGASADRDRAPAVQSRVASARPTGNFREEFDGSPDRTKRTVEWELTIKVQAATNEPKDAYAELDLLTAVAHNALVSKSYGGFTVAWHSRLGRGRIVDRDHPEVRYVATGSFTYVYNSLDGGLSQARP